MIRNNAVWIHGTIKHCLKSWTAARTNFAISTLVFAKWQSRPPWENMSTTSDVTCSAIWIWIWQLVGRAPGWGITPTGCACYGPGCLLSRLLRDAAESADATDWGIAFHSLMVRVANENLYSLVFDLRVSSLLVLVSLPRIGRLLNFKSRSAIGTATWPLRILYMKASLCIRRLVWRGSSLSCSNRDACKTAWLGATNTERIMIPRSKLRKYCHGQLRQLSRMSIRGFSCTIA